MRTLVCLAAIALVGCAVKSLGDRERQVVLAPGVAGDRGYGELRKGLTDGRVDLPIHTFSWGAPLPLFIFNFQSRGIHKSAEVDLAKAIVE